MNVTSTSATSHKQAYPLCSITLLAYNQERYIKDSLQSVLDQTYPNLEIIISDDHSSDKTWPILQDLVSQYHGPHKIHLHRNEQNLGIGAHVSKVLKMIRGDIFIIGAGDDVFYPERVQKTCDAFQQQGPKTMLIWCNHEPIDENGQSRGVYKNFERDKQNLPRSLEEFSTKKCRKGWWACGALQAYRREVVDFFGGMNPTFICEDTFLSFRAFLLGRAEPINDVLIKYRSHSGSYSNSGDSDTFLEKYQKRIRGDCARLQVYGQAISDINFINNKYPERLPSLLPIEAMLLKALQRQLASCRIMSTFPHLSLKTLWKSLPYPGFYRHFIYATLYKLGFYNKDKKHP